MSPRARDLRVVLVDDEPAITDALSEGLALRGGFEVWACNDGREAVARIAELLPDVVVLDLHMPGFDGPDVMAALRNQASTAEIPIVVVTAILDGGDGGLGLVDPRCRYVAKPASIAEVARAVQESAAGEGGG